MQVSWRRLWDHLFPDVTDPDTHERDMSAARRAMREGEAAQVEAAQLAGQLEDTRRVLDQDVRRNHWSETVEAAIRAAAKPPPRSARK